MSTSYPNTIKDILETKKNVLITDGASRGNPGPAGWAYILLAGEKDFAVEQCGFSEKDTNNRMEILGALEGIKKFHKLNLRNSLYILSDSKFLIDAISVWRFSWRKNNWTKSGGDPVLHSDLWKELDVTVDSTQPTWFHVEAHKGHPGNTRCDELAVGAALQKVPPLFEGPLADYGAFTKLTYQNLFPEVRYLCWGGTIREQFGNWDEAQKFLKENPGCKVRKIFSSEEADSIV